MSDAPELNRLLDRLLEPFARSIGGADRNTAKIARREFDTIFEEFCEEYQIEELDRQ